MIDVETPAGREFIEMSGNYRGVYHVLHGAFSLAPTAFIWTSWVTASLIGRAPVAPVREVLLAMNPSAEGEATLRFT